MTGKKVGALRKVRGYSGEMRYRLMLEDGKYMELVPGGKLAYVWVGNDEAYYSATDPHDPSALRAFARAVLKEVGE